MPFSYLRAQRDKKQSGFSLTEMAIVFVAASAIITLVMAGANLIENARNSGLYSDVGNFTRAVEQFYRKYRALPGDMSDVSDLPGATAGNGNSVIDTTDADETRLFWQHLQLAGFIEGDYGGGSSNVPGVDVPEGPYENTGYSVVASDTGEIIIRLSRFSSGADDLGIFTPEDAENIDETADDGKPSTAASRIRGVNSSDAADDDVCITGTGEDAAYKVSLDQTVCVMHFVLNPYIAPTDTESSPNCPRLGATRVSDARTCPVGYPGKVVETCRPDGWTITDITCEAAKCAGEREYVFKDERVETCPDNYTGTVLRVCSATGLWVDAADQTGNACTEDTSVCTVEGHGRILACGQGQVGSVMQTCTSGNWVTDSDTCTAITCSNPSSGLGVVESATDITGATESCLDDNPLLAGDNSAQYTCKNPDGTNCAQQTDGIFKVCSMTGAGTGKWEIAANQCVPNGYSSLLPASCTAGDNVSLGCPLGETGQNNFRCVEVNDNGDTDWEPVGINTCRPLSCGDFAIGSIRESRQFSCPDGMAGDVYEVCNLCEFGEPCFNQQDGGGNYLHRNKALWEVNYSNCAPQCDGSADNAGYAIWPNATAGTSNIRSASCLEGYYGVAVRSCDSVASSPPVPAHGRWSVPSKSCFLPPFSLAGLTLWLDADNDASLQPSSGTLTNGSYISTWYDASDENINMSNTNSGEYPQYQTNSINGKPALYFENDTLHAGNTTDLGFERTDDWSAIAAHKVYGGNTGVLMSKMLGSSPFTGWDSGRFFSTTPVYIISTWTSNALQSNTGGFRIWGDEPSIQTVTYDGSSSASGIVTWLNGYKLPNIPVYDSLTGSMANSAQFRIGARGVSGSLSTQYRGHIGEILLYEVALTDAKRRQVEDYLSEKWDIQIAPRFAEYTGLRLWLDAMDVDGDGDLNTDPSSTSLDVWFDKGPLRRHAKQTTSGNRPTWVASGTNGKPSVSFDGTNDYMTFDSNPFDTGNTPYSIMLVAEVEDLQNNAGSTSGFISNGTFSSPAQSVSLRSDSSGFFVDYWWSNDARTSASTLKSDTPFILGSIYDEAGADGGRRIYMNGEEVGFASNTNRDGVNGTALLGKAYNNQYMYGYINEVMVYNKTLSEDERKSIEQYLAGKWGIAILWSPDNISGLTMWLDADSYGGLVGGWYKEVDGVGSYASTGRTWKDKSGNGYDAIVINADADTYPTFSNIGPLASAYFQPSKKNQFYQEHPDIEAVGASAHSYFIVAQPNDGDGGILSGFSTSNCSNALTCYTSGIRIASDEHINVVENGLSDALLDDETYASKVFMLSVLAQPGETKFYLNGKLKRSSDDAFLGATSTGFRLGYMNNDSDYYEGHIGEVILYNRVLSDAERETVEAYLANKWPIGQGWAPTKIPGLELWLDAADASSVELNQNAVGLWRNKATENAALQYATPGGSMQWVKNAKNGLPVMRATDGYFATNGSVTPKVIIMAHKTPIKTSAWNTLWDARAATTDAFYNNSDSGKDNTSTNTFRYTGYVDGKAYIFRSDSGDGSISASGYVSPVFKNEYTISVFLNYTSSAGRLDIYRHYQDKDYSSGDIAEVLVFNRHITTTERMQAETYLSEKWGIPVVRPNLDSPAYGIKGLSLWLDAADQNTVSIHNYQTNVSAWGNKGSLLYSAEQLNPSKQPVYDPDGITTSTGNLPSMRFNGGQSINVRDLSMYPVMTVFLVSQYDSGTSDSLFIEHANNLLDTPTTDGFWLWGGNRPIRIERGNTEFQSETGFTGWLGTSPSVATFYNDGQVGGFYKNTSTPISQTPLTTFATAAMTNSIITDTLYIGGRGNATATPLTQGDIGEILIYDRYLPSYERKIVEEYLVNKWVNGIQASSVVGTIGASQGITAWFDASSASAMTVDGSNYISQLNDIKSGTPKYHSLQSNASQRPQYVANVQNGLGVMRFDGVDDVLTMQNDDTSNALMLKEVIGSAAFDEDDDFTVISVLKVASATENDGFPTSNQMVFGVSSAQGNVGLAVRSDPTRLVGFTLVDGLAYQAAKEISMNTFYVTVLYQGAGSLYFDVNGENISKQPAQKLAAGLDSAAFMVGGGNSSKPFKGDIGEFITFSKKLAQNQREDVETYLGGKWGIAITTGNDTGEELLDPSAVAGLTLWLDADDATTMNSGAALVEGSVITSIDDKSANGLDFCAGNGSTSAGCANAGPTYKPNFLNGRAVLQFNGTNQRLETTVSVPSERFVSKDQGSFFVVHRPSSPQQDDHVFDWTPSYLSNQLRFIAPWSTGAVFVDFGKFNSGGRLTRDAPSDYLDNWNLFSFVRKTNATGVAYINGELFEVDTMTDLLDNTGSSKIYYAWTPDAGGDKWSKGFLAEFLFYNAELSDQDRQSIEDYLMAKWGIGQAVVQEQSYLNDPDEVPGLVQWLDSNDTDTLYSNNDCSTGQAPASGTAIGCWKDKSDSAANVTQSSAGSRPIFYDSLAYSSRGLTFDGTNDSLSGSAVLSAGDDSYTIIGVWEANNKSDDVDGVVWEQNASAITSGQRAAMVNVYYSGNYYGFAGEGASYTAKDVPVTLSERVVGAIVSNGTALTITMNGEVYNRTTSDRTLGANVVYVGRKLAGGAYNDWFNGNILELIVYENALTETQRGRVEAYLTSKWLVADSDMPTATPRNGLRLWLDATDSSTLFGGSDCSTSAAPTNGQDVGCWQDKSGNNYHATQTVSAATRPHVSTAGINGKQALDFDGTNHHLTLGSNYLFSNNDGLTIFAAASPQKTSGDSWFISFGNYGFNGASQLDYDSYGILLRKNIFVFVTPYVQNDGTGDAGGAFTSYSSDLNESVIITSEAVFGNKQRLYINGTEVMSESITNLSQITASEVTAAATRGASSGPFTIGYQSKTFSETTRAYQGKIGEIMVYDRALSKAEREGIENYLMDKWVPQEATISSDISLWLDASDVSTINAGTPVDGDEVSTWTNKAGNANIPSVGKDTNGPTFKTNQLNGLPVLNFGGNSAEESFVRANVSRSHLFNSDEVSFFSVQQLVGASSSNTNALFWQNGKRFNLALPAGSKLRMNFGTCCAEGTVQVNADVPTNLANQWHTVSAIKYSPTGGKLFVDGVEIASESLNDTISDVTADLFIGADSGAGYFFQGNIAEILVYRSALDEPARLAVENYLQDKWRPSEASVAGNIDPNGLTLWFDATDMSTLNDGSMNDGDDITLWRNKANNANFPYVKAVSSPQYQANAVNGRAAVRFNSSQSDYFILNNVKRSDFVNSNEMTFFAAQQTVGDAAFSTSTIFWQNSSSQRVNLHWADGVGDLAFDFGVCCTQRQSVAMGSDFLNNWHVMTALKKSDDTGAIYKDGVSVVSGAMAKTIDDLTASFYVGRTSGSGFYFNGAIGEMLMYRTALSDSDRQDVENYLMDKWLQSEPIKSAKMVQPGKLALWLDAQDNATLVGHSNCTIDQYVRFDSDVGCWKDKSGNDFHATQSASAANKPHLVSNSINGRQALEFDNTALQHLILGSNYIYSNTDGLLLFTVAKPQNAETGGLGYIYDFGVFNTEGYGLYTNIASSKLSINFYTGLSHQGVSTGGTTASVKDSVVITSEVAFGLYQNLYINGKLLASNPNILLAALGDTQIGQSATRTAISSPVTIGSQGKTGSEVTRAFKGAIGEVLVYTNTTMSQSERQAVEKYLMDKWGIEDQSLAAIASPQTPNSLVLWLDASDSSTINAGASVADYGAITEWRDKSDNANRAVRFRTSGSDSGVRYRSSVMNGYPSLRFDTVPLKVEGSSDLNVSSAGTWFMVASSDTDAGSQRGVLMSKGYDETNFSLIWENSSYKGLQFCSGANGASCRVAGNGYNNMKEDTPYILTYRYKAGSPGTADFFKTDGSSEYNVSLSMPTGLSNATGSTYLMVGGQATDDSGSFTEGFTGNISELLMYNYYVEGAERKGVENYLKSKWGMLEVPKTIGGLTLWLDAADESSVNNGSTITANGLVTAWEDKSGNAVHMQSTEGSIRYGNSSAYKLNNKPVMVIDDSNALAFTSAQNISYRRVFGSNEFTTFSVSNQKDGDYGGSLFFWQDHSSGLERINLHMNGETGLALDVGTCCTAGVSRLTSSPVPSWRNQWWIVTTTRAPTTATIEVDSNSYATISSGAMTDSMAVTSTQALHIAGLQDQFGTKDKMVGSLAEVIIYRRALTTQERTVIRRYLGSKWGVSVR